MPNLFNYNLLIPHIQKHNIDGYEEKHKVISSWKSNLRVKQRVIEVELQSAFLKGIFGVVLGYRGITEGNGQWDMRVEASTEIDATKPDGILGFYTKDSEITQAVIELKGPKISLDKKQKTMTGKDYGTSVDQAFSYASKFDRCKWVIVSNMIEIRLYKVGRSQEHYESFQIEELDKEKEFKKFHLLLCKENLLSVTGDSATSILSERTKGHIQDISVEFYNLYRDTRIRLFEELKMNNPDYEPEVLLEKAQKFLDRIIFICFCEDLGLLPNDLLPNAIRRSKEFFSTSETVTWDEVKGIFSAIDKGSGKHNIPSYDGGLFKHDDILNALVIRNEFFDVIYKISAYDFNSDLDANILGHIFEQSIIDIEELRADIQNDGYSVKHSRRKEEGIYYTPRYITKYIVDNSVGKYLEEIRKELGEDSLPDIEVATTPQMAGRCRNRHLKFYREYEERVKKVKVLDPACGSGAFLNQAFDYLLNEYRWIHDQISNLHGEQITIFQQSQYQKSVLQNNLYGVDLNEESVEITKLSLWLKTANKNEPLAYLDDNIKCGNSLIDDPEVAGEKAFKWEEEFSEIMNKGGFQVVIGNPPYVVLNPDMLEKYNFVNPNYNTYVAFIELATRLTCKNGLISYIVPTTWLSGDNYRVLREFLLSEKMLLQLIQLPYDIFYAYVDTVILTFQNSNDTVNDNQIFVYRYPPKKKQAELVVPTYNEIDINIWRKNDNLKIFLDIDIIRVLEKIDSMEYVLMGDIAIINRGTRPPSKDCYVEQSHPNSIQWFNGQVFRYDIKEDYDKKHVDYTELKENKPLELFTTPRILGRQLVSRQFRLMFTYTTKQFAFKKNIYAIIPNTSHYHPIYILSILNSSLFSFIQIGSNASLQRDDYPAFSLNDFKTFRIPKVSIVDQRKFITCANSMIQMNEIKRKLCLLRFIDIVERYTSKVDKSYLKKIIFHSPYNNIVYSGRVSTIRNITVIINGAILTVYVDKSNNGKHELVKFEIKDHYKRQYIKLFLENLTDNQLDEINGCSGNILEKVLQIQIPDYNKDQVVRRVVTEWNDHQREIESLIKKIEQTDQEIDQMVYELYGLSEDDVKIIEK